MTTIAACPASSLIVGNRAILGAAVTLLTTVSATPAGFFVTGVSNGVYVEHSLDSQALVQVISA